MSKKTGPFDTVINCLQVMADRDFANGAPHKGAFRAAIRVLEAARRVDKDEAKKWLSGTCHSSATTPSKANWIARNHEQVRALLEALPEPEEERK